MWANPILTNLIQEHMTSRKSSFASMCLQKMAEANVDSVTPSNSGKGRKRVRKLYTWKRNERKTQRNFGKSYTTAKNKEVCNVH